MLPTISIIFFILFYINIAQKRGRNLAIRLCMYIVCYKKMYIVYIINVLSIWEKIDRFHQIYTITHTPEAYQKKKRKWPKKVWIQKEYKPIYSRHNFQQYKSSVCERQSYLENFTLFNHRHKLFEFIQINLLLQLIWNFIIIIIKLL